jgi:hypothetical protein
MWEYYCKKCNKTCDFDEEIELRETDYEGDWQEFHIVCDSKVILKLK